MDRKRISSGGESSLCKAPFKFSCAVQEKSQCEKQEIVTGGAVGSNIPIDLREIYFLIMHFLSAGPFQRTFEHLCDELLEHQLLPRRYHGWFSKRGTHSGNDSDDGISFPLSYNKLVERYPHIEKDHLVKLLKQLILHSAAPSHGMIGRNAPNAADVPTLLGFGSFSLLGCDKSPEYQQVKPLPVFLRWPHMQADQVHGLSLREIGGGFKKHHRAPSIRSACYAIAKPSTMVQKMQNIKKLRGHRDAVYCAIFDRSGRYVITGSDDRLVKIWSMETAFCLASCRGHEGDITDLAVSSNNALVASASNDFVIRVWRLPDGMPISVLRGHTGAVTAIAFSPKPSSVFQLLSSSDDGTCRIWDVRSSHTRPVIYVPSPSNAINGKSNGLSNNGTLASNNPQSHQILCCAYNANGTVFVTGSSDTYARVWCALKGTAENTEQPIHELDVLRGHENDVNYVQFSGCAVAQRSSTSDVLKEDNVPKFKNYWFCHDNIVTCSRDGSAIIWIPRSRRSHGKFGRWTRAYHLKVPPPPLPPQPPRGGPRQRLLPTPRGVNMIVWSLDNRFVLAAIMDCRICVWNAVDGSLVHCLTGHTASSYVLDVHPFNPRIAMSAGYDGKTIIWDIWEGTPIRTYEIGRFKLVDGKFSQDGTSIVLSDEVGQIYLLNTGQGESQKDAKYDQFFLGDYRPLIRDSAGNVLDQETQLVPHRRNLQDPLCDSSMMPYPEPYQSMYQQHRLGALGVEWRPSSIKFAVGPDIFLGQDYEMPPLADLERMIEPLPEFVDAIYWEPENEIISDDNDSEYNVAEECSSEAEQGSLCSGASSDPGSSDEDIEVECGYRDGLRRSRRRKLISEAELMNSRKRIKKSNLSEHDGSVSGSNKTKKSKSARRASKRKSSEAKTLRPQRVAARNARSMFSKITGTSTDADVSDDLDDDSSNGELVLEDLDMHCSEAYRNMPNMQQKYIKEEKPSLAKSQDLTKPSECAESHLNNGNRKKIVLKFSLRDSKKPMTPIETILKDENQAVPLHASSRPPQDASEGNKISISSKDLASSSADAIDVKSKSYNGLDDKDGRQAKKVENHLEKSAGAKENIVRWGEVKIRTTKHSKSADVVPIDASAEFNAGIDLLEDNQIDLNGFVKSENEHTKLLSEQETCKDGYVFCRDKDSSRDESLQDPGSMKYSECAPLEEFGSVSFAANQTEGGAYMVCNGNLNIQSMDFPGSNEQIFYRPSKINGSVGAHHSQELEVNASLKSTKFKIIRKLRSPSSSSKLRLPTYNTADGGNIMTEKSSSVDHDAVLEVQENGESSSRSTSYENDELYNYATGSEGFDAAIEQYNSHDIESHATERDLSTAANDATRRKRSTKIKSTLEEPDARSRNLKVRVNQVSASKNLERSSMRARDQLQPKEWASTSRVGVRSRSSRSKRNGGYDNNPNFSAAKKSNNVSRKLSWLMLSEPEEGYRYIPQLGDEVVYIRQGHQEFVENQGLAELGPWKSHNESLRAVEICKVEQLDYATYPGSGDSCCKITLKFVDPKSRVHGIALKLTLPELVNSADFIVEKTRYDAAIKRNWTVRDKCLVWWKNGDDEGGSWWAGRIISTEPKSENFCDSPWERYLILYKGSEEYYHSPWELHDPEIPWEGSHIDADIRDKLLSAFDKFEHSDNYGIQKLNDAAQKLDFCNRFPVPLYPELIRLRLVNNYYRNFEAVEHDIEVMTSNAESYFARSTQLSSKMRRLSDFFSKLFSRLSLAKLK